MYAVEGAVRMEARKGDALPSTCPTVLGKAIKSLTVKKFFVSFRLNSGEDSSRTSCFDAALLVS